MVDQVQALGDAFLVNTATAGAQLWSTITGLTGGGFVISWQDASGQGGDTSGFSIKAQIYDAAGAPVGGEFLVNTATLNDQQYPTITGLATGGFVVSWADSSGQGGDADRAGVKAQIYDATGVQVGGEFLVNTATRAAQDYPAITGLANGGCTALGW